MSEEISYTKITNPMVIAHLSDMVKTFVERVKVPNLSWHGLIEVLQQRAQFGGDLAEVWMARNSEEILGWAAWRVSVTPFTGTVHFDYIQTKGNRRDITREFIKEFVKFSEKHNAPWMQFDVTRSSRKVLNHFITLAEEQGITIKPNLYTPCIATKIEYYGQQLKGEPKDG